MSAGVSLVRLKGPGLQDPSMEASQEPEEIRWEYGKVGGNVRHHGATKMQSRYRLIA